MSNESKLFTDGKHTVKLENGLDDMYKIIGEVWNVSPFQTEFKYDEENKYWNVYLTDKVGNVFTRIGAINFDPNEN